MTDNTCIPLTTGTPWCSLTYSRDILIDESVMLNKPILMDNQIDNHRTYSVLGFSMPKTDYYHPIVNDYTINLPSDNELGITRGPVNPVVDGTTAPPTTPPPSSDQGVINSRNLQNIKTVSGPGFGNNEYNSDKNKIFVITALEIMVYNSTGSKDFYTYNKGNIGKITGVYYAELKDVSNPTNWRSVTETVTAPLVISGVTYTPSSNFNTSIYDLDVSGNANPNSIGDHLLSDNPSIGNRVLFTAPLGYALSGIGYLMNRANDTPKSLPISILELFFTNIYDSSNYILSYNGANSLTPTVSQNINNNLTYFRNDNSFIQQVLFNYWDYKGANKNIDLTMGLGIADATVTIDNVRYNGVKGIAGITYVQIYGLKEIYNSVTPLQCCQLDPKSMFSDDSIEKQICTISKNLVIVDDFPLYYPRDSGSNSCYPILQSYCDGTSTDMNGKTSYNIVNGTCKTFCDLGNNPNSSGSLITPSNCDNAIKNYCNSDKFKYNGPVGEIPSNPTLDGSEHIPLADISGNTRDMEALANDPVCACSVPVADHINRDGQYFLSGASSLDVVVANALKDENKPLWKSPSRTQCTFPECYKSPYKLYSQKKNKSDTPCSELEACVGNGYSVPIYKNNIVACENPMNNLIGCSFESGPYSVIPPDVTFIPDPINQSCSSYFTSPVDAPFREGPKKCTTELQPGPCLNNKMYYYTDEKERSYPLDDRNKWSDPTYKNPLCDGSPQKPVKIKGPPPIAKFGKLLDTPGRYRSTKQDVCFPIMNNDSNNSSIIVIIILLLLVIFVPILFFLFRKIFNKKK